MESYKIFGATGFNDTHHVSSSLSLSNTSIPYRTQSMDTGLQELPYVPHESRNEGSSIFYYKFFELKMSFWQAVLLLRPNLSLFSSDVLPVNCSPYNSNSDPWSSTVHKSSISPRTCECLTQSLCCHGCGSTIGYMIIAPVMSMTFSSISVIKPVILQCSRCTFSLSETNRATNGHRFVFQSTEVLGTERRYIPHEKGIIPFATQWSNLYHADNHADSYGQVDSLSTAPALEFTNILDYSQQQPLEYDSWVVSFLVFFYITTN